MKGPYHWMRSCEIRDMKTGIYGTTVAHARSEGLLPGPNEDDLGGSFCAYGAIAYEGYRKGYDAAVVDEAEAMLIDAIRAEGISPKTGERERARSLLSTTASRRARSKCWRCSTKQSPTSNVLPHSGPGRRCLHMKLTPATRALLKQEVDRRRRIIAARHRRAHLALDRFVRLETQGEKKR